MNDSRTVEETRKKCLDDLVNQHRWDADQFRELYVAIRDVDYAHFSRAPIDSPSGGTPSDVFAQKIAKSLKAFQAQDTLAQLSVSSFVDATKVKDLIVGKIKEIETPMTLEQLLTKLNKDKPSLLVVKAVQSTINTKFGENRVTTMDKFKLDDLDRDLLLKFHSVNLDTDNLDTTIEAVRTFGRGLDAIIASRGKEQSKT